MTAMNKRVDGWANEAAEMMLSEERQAIKVRHVSRVADLKAMVAIAQSVMSCVELPRQSQSNLALSCDVWNGGSIDRVSPNGSCSPTSQRRIIVRPDAQPGERRHAIGALTRVSLPSLFSETREVKPRGALVAEALHESLVSLGSDGQHPLAISRPGCQSPKSSGTAGSLASDRSRSTSSRSTVIIKAVQFAIGI
jgi:hypothetical protein